MTIPLGIQIRGFRIQHGQTRVQVAKAAGLDYYHYCAIERGNQLPSLKTVNRIANVLRFQVTLKPKGEQS